MAAFQFFFFPTIGQSRSGGDLRQGFRGGRLEWVKASLAARGLNGEDKCVWNFKKLLKFSHLMLSPQNFCFIRVLPRRIWTFSFMPSFLFKFYQDPQVIIYCIFATYLTFYAYLILWNFILALNCVIFTHMLKDSY